jgi:hypothetical protein
MLLHLNSTAVRVLAVKLDGEGWVGVSTDAGRCHGHGHETPELAKLCALHRLQAPAGDGKVLLLPVAGGRRGPQAAPAPANRKRSAGRSR